MSKTMRLQVLMEESELQALRRVARRQGVTVAHVVRDALRAARDRESAGSPAAMLQCIRAAARQVPEGSAVDIDQILAEIESGYLSGSRQ